MASLLKTAEELRIKGLAEVSWRDDENDNTENNDSNNNNVTESNTSFPHMEPTPSSSAASSVSNTHHNLQREMGANAGSVNSCDRKEYDNKENMLKAMPFLAPLSSPPKDLSSPSSSTSRKKRGRPPLDDSNNFTKT